jgi:hypothetical protein
MRSLQRSASRRQSQPADRNGSQLPYGHRKTSGLTPALYGLWHGQRGGQLCSEQAVRRSVRQVCTPPPRQPPARPAAQHRTRPRTRWPGRRRTRRVRTGGSTSSMATNKSSQTISPWSTGTAVSESCRRVSAGSPNSGPGWPGGGRRPRCGGVRDCRGRRPASGTRTARRDPAPGSRRGRGPRAAGRAARTGAAISVRKASWRVPAADPGTDPPRGQATYRPCRSATASRWTGRTQSHQAGRAPGRTQPPATPRVAPRPAHRATA